MNRKAALIFVFLFAFILSGCFHDRGTTNTSRPQVDISSINVTLEGTLGAASPTGEYSLQTSAGPKLLHDGNAALAGFVGQKIRVTGQYSGSTLYVDQIEIIQ